MTDKPSEMLAKLGYQESSDLFAVYNEAEYNQLLETTQALEQRVEGLERLERACIKLYVGKIAMTEWRYVVRNGPLAKKLIALAEEEA